ncbi:hypothetical protein ACTNEY_12470 [Fusicatenibacter saccharivorans]|uniref:hypothetical protein n=1 Tax=Fusicatenibacter saccharivorans TaxID=1150298 RepID=UPI00302578B5|nr:hypothetical protein [Fusicatenibacter saccharivorans]
MEDITISELYSKYTSGIEELENDRYFQYLFEMIQAGDNTLQQKNRVLHKVVDERWLTVVEEGIEAIFHIVEKPRRFIATTEEVVPVALAKKITADSVRHLSQNTQFITSNEAGEIQPTRILNVTSEESFDLYENRFVYHLIQRLFAFVDKRTDVIFWSTGDETCNVMSMESKIDDAYEEISYKVEMTIKNRQSYAENDTDHMDIFKRIDRVRRLSRTLRTSSFCDIMGGCAKVYSPIQRTNLMMKDPDYRKCYQLWQFIEGYDEVGYTIEEQDSALQFDEEYLLQMYINFITNYTVFKSILESDERNVKELAREKREPVKPKFVKEIREEIVEDRNVPDVEIRKVFVEEVTEAQLKAEADLEKEKERSADLESSLSETEFQLNSVSQQLDFLEQELAQARQEKEALAAEAAREMQAKRKVEEQAKEAIAAAQKEKEDRIAKAEKKAEEEKTAAINEAKEKAQKEIAEEKAKAMEQVERAKMQQQTAEEEAEKECRKWKKRSEDAQRQAKKAREEKEKKQKAATEAITKAQEEVKRIRQEAEKAAEEAQNQLMAMQKEKDRALAKAEAGTLSHYLLQVLKERKERKKDKEEDRENK